VKQVLVTVTLIAWLGTAASASDQATLVGFAKLPPDTFTAGPSSGHQITPTNGRIPPFPNQPYQGISAILRASNGDLLAMPDNGYGQQINSADFVLRLYRISPDFKTKNGGSGAIDIESFITLRDPDHRIPFVITAELATYPGTSAPVDTNIAANRWLTGADFDIESVREAHDGTLWFGDEFGPFLIHTDATGKVVDAPIPLPGVKSPQNPYLAAGEVPNLPRSKGFEGMAISPNGHTLYPLLEGPLVTDSDQRRLIINEFDVENEAYTGRQWCYRLEVSTATGQSIGDMTAVNDHLFIVIERDNNEGAAAQFKKLYLIDLNDTDVNGCVAKHELVDLLNVADPDHLSPYGGSVFRFPFQTIESVLPLSQNLVAVLDDNNYPFSAGRVPGQPDPNEFILIRLQRPLVQYAK
jgi:hypothetical protein